MEDVIHKIDGYRQLVQKARIEAVNQCSRTAIDVQGPIVEKDKLVKSLAIGLESETYFESKRHEVKCILLLEEEEERSAQLHGISSEIDQKLSALLEETKKILML